MTEQEVNNLIDSKIAKTKMSQLPEATQTSGLYSIGYTGNQSVKYKANLLQGDPLTVRKTYQTEAEAIADKNPIDTTTSLPLTVGQFVSIVDDGEKNGIYRIGSIGVDGTMALEFQGKLGDLTEYTKTGGSTKTTKEIDDTKANHGYTSLGTAKTLKEVEDNASVKIKNEAVNGNFEAGTRVPFFNNDGFGGESTLAINSSTPISGNYDVRFTITTPATSESRPNLRGLHSAGNIGDKIYLHFYAKILSGTPMIHSINVGSISPRTIYGGDVVNGRNTRIVDAEGGSDDLGIIYFNSLSVWDMQMDNLMHINLTETFGAGNEPTEEEMSLLLDMLPVDYFEGEYTIPQEVIFRWQQQTFKQLAGSVVGTINLLQLNSSVWETGAISSDSGLSNGSLLPRLRTIDYFPIESNHDYNVSIQSDHKIAIHLYGLNEEYIRSAVSAIWITNNLSFKTPDNAVYYKCVISKADDSTLNVDELVNVRIKLAKGIMPTDFSEAPEDVNRRMDYAAPPTIRKDILTQNVSIDFQSGIPNTNSARLASSYIMNLKGISNVPKEYNYVFRYYNENLDFEEGDSNWREGSGVTSNFPFARIVFRLKSEEDFNAQNTEYLLNSINIHADDKYLSDEIINFTGFGYTAAGAGAFNNLDIYFSTQLNQLRQIINETSRPLPLLETILYLTNGQLYSFSLEKGFLLKGKLIIFRDNGIVNTNGVFGQSEVHTATDYIEINDNPIYFNLIARNTVNMVSFYDESKQYLSGVRGLATDSNNLKVYEYKKDGIIPPMLAKYARFSRYTSVFLFNQGMGDGNYIYQKDNEYLNDEIPAIPTSQSDQSDLRDDIPENIGVYNTIRKAKQMTDIKFTPKNPIKYNAGTYNAGTTYTGIIYSSTKEINTYIGRNVSFHTFMTAINNPRSLIYTEEINKDPYHGVNSRAYYGVVCSTFVAYCWGIDVDYRTYDFVLADFTEEIKDQSAYGLKLGDGVWNPGHIIIVTGIQRTNKGLIERIELCEAAQTGCRKFYINSANAFDSWMKTGGGRIIYRNTELYSNRDYTPVTDFVAVEDESITPFVYNDLICCNKGDRANYRVGENVILNIVEGYSNLEIYKDDVLLNTEDLTDNVDIEFSNLSYGSYKARITRAGEESDFTYWEVVDTDVTLDKVNNRVYFSSQNATPQYFEFCDISGFRPEDYSKIDTHVFTEEEISQGYIDVEVPSTIPDADRRTYPFAKVHFKNSYGVIINEPINWYE